MPPSARVPASRALAALDGSIDAGVVSLVNIAEGLEARPGDPELNAAFLETAAQLDLYCSVRERLARRPR